MKHSILVVDDEVDNVDALERLFRRKYNVLKAISGKEALKIVKQESVALILTDQRMPQMTGVELLTASMDHQPDAMRILLTGYTDIESVISAVNSGQIYRYITKPWDPVDLANTVDKAIERYELSAELKDKNKALEAALSELRTLDEAKSNFMILINHELKTPLTSMSSFLQLLAESDLSDEQKKFTDRIQTSADRLHALINDSLELVSAETGVMPIKSASVDIKKFLNEALGDLQARADAKSMTLDLLVSARSVRADQKALRSIFHRLLDNAIKFGFERTTIQIVVQADSDGKVSFTIDNEGKGVKADRIEKILRPFALDENIMHHSQGTGLGLSVVQALLHRLGSQLHVECPKGHFVVRFSLPSG